jgi:hypothetical protein
MFAKVKSWFKHSETILLARLQVLIGAVVQVIIVTDPSVFASLVGAKYLPLVMIGHGILLEVLRKRNDPDMK